MNGLLYTIPFMMLDLAAFFERPIWVTVLQLAPQSNLRSYIF
jgi:hypothetical protein